MIIVINHAFSFTIKNSFKLGIPARRERKWKLVKECRVKVTNCQDQHGDAHPLKVGRLFLIITLPIFLLALISISAQPMESRVNKNRVMICSSQRIKFKCLSSQVHPVRAADVD